MAVRSACRTHRPSAFWVLLGPGRHPLSHNNNPAPWADPQERRHLGLMELVDEVRGFQGVHLLVPLRHLLRLLEALLHMIACHSERRRCRQQGRCEPQEKTTNEHEYAYNIERLKKTNQLNQELPFF